MDGHPINPRGLRSNPVGTFVVGLVTGIMLASAGAAVSQEDDVARGFATSVLYAIAQLSVDTERNAVRISELADRVDDLEEAMRKNAMTARK